MSKPSNVIKTFLFIFIISVIIGSFIFVFFIQNRGMLYRVTYRYSPVVARFLHIYPSAPVIDAISPTTTSRSNFFTIKVRGENLLSLLGRIDYVALYREDHGEVRATKIAFAKVDEVDAFFYDKPLLRGSWDLRVGHDEEHGGAFTASSSIFTVDAALGE